MPHEFSKMFELAMPWWEFVLRACIVYFILLAMIRASGKRTMGQFTPFDMLLVVLLGNAVQNALLGEDTSVGGGLLLAATLIALNWGVGLVSARSPRVEAMIEGTPVLLARDGKIFRDVLRKELISRADFDKALREAGCLDVDDIDTAVLETNGHVTIITKPGTTDPAG
ncbi:MAG: YetF domain-containing protein [Pseudoxanthomonas sp.]